MLESRSGPLVLEVNSSPGLEGIESVVGEGFVAAEVARLLNRRLEESQRRLRGEQEHRDDWGR